MLRYIAKCHSCQIPTTDQQVFVDKNESIEFARNHSNELKHCCSVMKDGQTIPTSIPWIYRGTPGELIALFIFGREIELPSNT